MKPALTTLLSALFVSLGSAAYADTPPSAPVDPTSHASHAEPTGPAAPAETAVPTAAAVPTGTTEPAAPDRPDAPRGATPPAVDAAAIEKLVDARVDERLRKQPATAGWKNGFFVQTPDGATRLKIGGFTQFDGRFFVADSRDPRVDQFGFRSIRPTCRAPCSSTTTSGSFPTLRAAGSPSRTPTSTFATRAR